MKISLLLVSSALGTSGISFAESQNPSGVVSVETDTIKICVYGDYLDHSKECNRTLNRLSLLSNDRVQMTGSCRDADGADWRYCALLKVRVTVFP